MLCQIVVGPQFQNFMSLMLPFSLVARPQKMLTVTLNEEEQFFYLPFLKVKPETKCVL